MPHDRTNVTLFPQTVLHAKSVSKQHFFMKYDWQ